MSLGLYKHDFNSFYPSSINPVTQRNIIVANNPGDFKNFTAGTITFQYRTQFLFLGNMVMIVMEVINLNNSSSSSTQDIIVPFGYNFSVQLPYLSFRSDGGFLVISHTLTSMAFRVALTNNNRGVIVVFGI
jgi:hypothetical protein